MTQPLDLIIVLRKLGACRESLAWLEKRRAEDPGASFAKRWAEAREEDAEWTCTAVSMSKQAPVAGSYCVCAPRFNKPLLARLPDIQRGLYARFVSVATPAEVEAARMRR